MDRLQIEPYKKATRADDSDFRGLLRSCNMIGKRKGANGHDTAFQPASHYRGAANCGTGERVPLHAVLQYNWVFPPDTAKQGA